jgi:RNA polymerase sigma-70 factor (ECF subfamily)
MAPTALGETTRLAPARREHDWQPLASLRLVPDAAVDAGLRELLGDPTAAPLAKPLTGSDESLAGRVAQDGQAPFAVLYARHRGNLHRYCLSVVRDHEEAADAAQEAWLRAFVALRSPQMRPISFRAWLYAIARNACTDRLRDRGRFSLKELSEHDLGRAESSADLHEAREDVRAVLADLAALSERQRSAIALREVAGLSVDEIAATLETTPPKAMSLIAEARRVLHERQAGRLLSCDAVRARIEMLRVHSHGVRAHLDDCAACRAHHAATRGRRLSSLGVLPLGFLRPLLARVGPLFRHPTGFDAFASKVAAAGAVTLVAGTGLAVHGIGGHHQTTTPRAASPGRVQSRPATVDRAPRPVIGRRAQPAATAVKRPVPSIAAKPAAPMPSPTRPSPAPPSTPQAAGAPPAAAKPAPSRPLTGVPATNLASAATQQLATAAAQGQGIGGKAIAGAPAAAQALRAAATTAVGAGVAAARTIGSAQPHL